MLEGQTYDDLTTAQIHLEQAKRQAAELIDAGEAVVRAAVRAQRASGATWKQIGARFGVSKQAAQKRFGG